ncbi:putative mitochondrial ATP synthase, epsilon chain [Leptomonas pyrrhocoris]|uniref:Putative mitochondrial ATP synthase, epsilon chain n=1 Tax=Leptomonas pyrrhocoris TaxID=157538 RepID=A0A0M9G516_LEPPY|nr:putative mitochondrial ATP synthase, epsilon chain [Leptomonas pyrrhocoris]KPA82550.1 putative mitochondrial ATP synthase, epsilon chain [Leptomonas pyrrhocoris]|eukprot:XP_015660989.1 putative mitochondrial ATP synthase, epsilon chain [Leptomonas pyrrhocoris]
MEALSTGFCGAALTQSLALEEIEEWQRQWPQPTLQVVDVQRYPRCPTTELEPCRFYVAASDGQSLVWLVVPPQTPLEEAIAGFELEVGCCMTLLSHTLVTAANGLNVVVPLQVKYSSNTLRLLGRPTCPDQLFPLSANSLVQRATEGEGTGVVGTGASTAAVRRPSHRIAVRDFVDNPERALGNWFIAVRVVWRGREYQMNSPSRTFGSHSVRADTPRFVFRCLLVDERGDGIVAAFFGSAALMDRVQLHDCLMLAQGTVKWAVSEVAAPVELQFGEKSIETLLDAESVQHTFPLYAAALVGEVAEDLRSVAAVLSDAQVGDYTSVVGLVVAVQGSTQITTKRGRVWRSVVTLADDTGPGNHCYMEVTLWGDTAELTEPSVGEHWVFHSCAVQLFQQRKTLSSRASTMAVQLRPLQLPLDSSAAALPRECVSVTAAAAETSPPAVTANESGAASTDPFPATPKPRSLQFVFNFHEASPTLPVLARVQEVLSPLLTWTCVACHSIVNIGSCDAYADAIPDRCGVCGGEELFPSCHLNIRMSDCLSIAAVTLHGSTAETLLAATALDLARTLQRRPAAGREFRAGLVGVPVLLWLLVEATEEGDTNHYVAAACKHIHCVSGCHTLLSAIDAFTGDLANGNDEVPLER